jgi:hypothetical protein
VRVRTFPEISLSPLIPSFSSPTFRENVNTRRNKKLRTNDINERAKTNAQLEPDISGPGIPEYKIALNSLRELAS